MKINILISLAGAIFAWGPGDIVDVADDEAQRLIAAGYAEPADAATPSLADMSAKELRAFAADQGIDVSDAKNKAEAIALIEAGLAAKAA